MNNNVPQSNRLHVGIFGETNAGKSSLFNALTGTDISIVSDLSGTTTDSVQKAMELNPFGPIVLIDTAGMGDDSPLGRQRMEKTQKILNRVDFALYVMDAAKIAGAQRCYKEFKAAAKNIPHLVVVTKSENQDSLYAMAKTFSLTEGRCVPAVCISIHQQDTIDALKKIMVQKLSEIKNDSEKSLLGDLLSSCATVLMVVPIDSGAPKGRLILPQAQLIRDCLDNGFMAHVVTEKEIGAALQNLKHVDLIVTDSQIFGKVVQEVPPDILLTSFSILMARQKGDIKILISGIKALAGLKKHGGKVLISEVCTHNRSHEDIGHVKIPAALRKIAGDGLSFDFTTGRDFPESPEDLRQYSLIIHCGACMITPKEMQNRIASAQEAGVPITNYGLFLAYINGILDRSIEILNR